MSLPFLAQLGIASAPTAIKTLNQVFNPSQESEYEKKVNSMAELFGEQAKAPITENTAYKSGKSVIDSRDKKSRERTDNTLGAGNVTSEGKLAGMQDNNEVYAQMLNGLMSRAQRFKEASQGRYMNALGLGEYIKNNRLNQRANSDASMIGGLSQGLNAFLLSGAQGGAPKS